MKVDNNLNTLLFLIVMKCLHCKKKVAINLSYLPPLCRFCFSHVIEKRIRKHIRINSLFRSGDVVVTNNNLCFYLLKKIIKNPRVKIVKKSSQKKAKIVIPWTTDDEIADFLENLFVNKKRKKTKEIKLLIRITDKEAILFAKNKNINYSPRKKKKQILHMLDKMEKKYPETRFSLLKSVDELEGIIQ